MTPPTARDDLERELSHLRSIVDVDTRLRILEAFDRFLRAHGSFTPTWLLWDTLSGSLGTESDADIPSSRR